MNKHFTKIPIEDSPWFDQQSSDDVVNHGGYLSGLGVKVVDLLEGQKSTSADSFQTGAQQAVARFNITTRAHKKTKRSSFRFSEQKEGDHPTTVFIVADAGRIEAQKQVLGLLQWCMFVELKRHKNHHRPVYLIADEATNFKLHDLGSLLTWGRGYGLRLHLIIQNLPVFRKVYGKDVLSTLLSETEIKQFLPGQREPETLALIEKSMLGEQSLIAEGHSGNKETPNYWISGTDYREEGRVLMTSDEIRRTDKSILILRRNKPMLTQLPPIAAIAPFRDIIDINPFHGKPFLRPVVLTLRRNKQGLFSEVRGFFCGMFKAEKPELRERKMRLLKMAKGARMASGLVDLWVLALIAAFIASPIGPHLRWSYQYHQFGNGPRSFVSCNYIGSRGMITPDLAPRCPLIVFLDSRLWRK